MDKSRVESLGEDIIKSLLYENYLKDSFQGLPLSNKEKALFKKQLKDVLSYISKLDEIDTNKVEPIAHIADLVNITRDDETSPSLSQEDALKNAPKIYNGFFEVDAIFEEQ